LPVFKYNVYNYTYFVPRDGEEVSTKMADDSAWEQSPAPLQETRVT